MRSKLLTISAALTVASFNSSPLSATGQGRVISVIPSSLSPVPFSHDLAKRLAELNQMTVSPSVGCRSSRARVEAAIAGNQKLTPGSDNWMKTRDAVVDAQGPCGALRAIWMQQIILLKSAAVYGQESDRRSALQETDILVGEVGSQDEFFRSTIDRLSEG